MLTVSEMAERILMAFRDAAKNKGVGEMNAATVYDMFGKEGSHDLIQQSIKYLLDRDLIAAHSYSLTAKGRIRQAKSAIREE